jgi:sugar phosphate permease
MLVMRLLLGALSSLCAGFLAARITKGSRGTVHMLACLLVVAFIPVHYERWDRFPVWYHLVFLVSLLAATIFGAMCYSYYARRKGEPLAD